MLETLSLGLLDFEMKCVGKGELILCLFLYVVI